MGSPNESSCAEVPEAAAVATAAQLLGLRVNPEEAAALSALLTSKRQDSAAIRELRLDEFDLPAIRWPEMLP